MSFLCSLSGDKCKKIKGPCSHERAVILVAMILLAGLDIKYLFHWF